MALRMLYVLPMLMGRTYDARNDRIGIDIFPQDTLDKALVLDEFESKSFYKVTESSRDIQQLLDIAGDLALKVKAGTVDLKGTGTYLKDNVRNEHTVEVLTRMTFKTVTYSLQLSSKPFENWLTKRKEDLGTHYVRSVTYGGELVASLRFRANNMKDIENIKAEVVGKLQGQLEDIVAEGKLDKLEESLQNKTSMEISYYATVPLKGVPNTIEGLKKLTKEFQDHVKEVNNGNGVPIRVELMELKQLDGNYMKFEKNQALVARLPEFEEYFDELRECKRRLTDWAKDLPMTLTSEQESQITAMLSRLNAVLRKFYDGIGNLNVEEGPGQLDEAVLAYREGKPFALPGKFRKEVDKLMNKMEIIEPERYVVSSSYIQWGNSSCTNASVLYSGYMAASTESGIGGGSNYLCLPSEPELEDTDTANSRITSSIGGVRYPSLEKSPFRDGYYLLSKSVNCALCHVTSKSTVTTFPGRKECPKGWEKAYVGFMMASSDKGFRTEYICMDEAPSGHSEGQVTIGDQILYPAAVIESDKKFWIPCSVCTR